MEERPPYYRMPKVFNHTSAQVEPFLQTHTTSPSNLITFLISNKLKNLIYTRKKFFYPSIRSRARRYSIAIIIVTVIGVFTAKLDSLGDTKILLLFSAVIFSSWYGGLGAGLLAAIYALFVDYYLSITYVTSLGPAYLIRLMIFGLASLFISYLISSKAKYEKLLYTQALHDSLTGLPNRRLIEEQLNFAINRAKRNKETVAIMFLDLDKFKNINDTMGHDIGDGLLQEVAKRLKGCVRSEDCVGRLGGDEFIVLLIDLKHQNDAKDVALKIIDCFDDEFKVKDKVIKTSTSIGISVYPEDGNDPSELMKSADEALYVVKELSRNNFIMFGEMSKYQK
jgi:diguanylate cyclase (GGDEF)-like protein